MAAKYGDPAVIFSYDWVPTVPGVNAAGNYRSYAADPWGFIAREWDLIRNGKYSHFIEDYAMVR